MHMHITMHYNAYKISCRGSQISLVLYFLQMLYTAQKMKFCSKDFSSKCDQSRRKLRIWSYLLKKSLMENFIFCVVIFSRYAILGFGLTLV